MSQPRPLVRADGIDVATGIHRVDSRASIASVNRRADLANVVRSPEQQGSPVVSEPASPSAREVASKGAVRQLIGDDTAVMDNRRSLPDYRDDRQLPVVNGIPVSTSLCGTAAVVRTVDQPPGDLSLIHISEPTRPY